MLRVKGYSHDEALQIITESLFERLVIRMTAIKPLIYVIRNEDV